MSEEWPLFFKIPPPPVGPVPLPGTLFSPEKRAQRLSFWVRRPPGGVGVFHAKGWWPKTSCPPSKLCFPWVSKRGIRDVPGILPGCPGPLAVFKKFVQKNFVRIFRSLFVVEEKGCLSRNSSQKSLVALWFFSCSLSRFFPGLTFSDTTKISGAKKRSQKSAHTHTHTHKKEISQLDDPIFRQKETRISQLRIPAELFLKKCIFPFKFKDVWNKY